MCQAKNKAVIVHGELFHNRKLDVSIMVNAVRLVNKVRFDSTTSNGKRIAQSAQSFFLLSYPIVFDC